MFARIGWRAPKGNQSWIHRLQSLSNRNKILALAGIVGSCAAIYYASNEALAFGYVEECLHAPKYPWEHNKMWKSYDHAAIRRGFLVYNTIGAACHSMKYRYYRQLVDVAYTEEEMKEIAANYDDYDAEPNDEGDVLKRPGVLNDKFHSPYENEKQARALNNGALPPDLSQIVRARDSGDNYLFALLTGYRDPPHGITLGENMNYNVYFPGCQIAMPAPLAEGAVTYEDGTEASISQQAKDVTIFLTWSAFMEQDERHLMGIKTLATLTFLAVPMFYWKRMRWSYIKKRKVEFLRNEKKTE